MKPGVRLDNVEELEDVPVAAFDSLPPRVRVSMPLWGIVFFISPLDWC